MKKLEGLYLVLDPSQEEEKLLKLLQEALKGGVSVIQIWDHWPRDITENQKKKIAKRIKEIAQNWKVPVLVNEDWKLALGADLDGIHWNNIPTDWEDIYSKTSGIIHGLTVSNDLKLVEWASRHKLSYISFCAVFPSSSVDTCEIVQPETILQAQQMPHLPIFLSGGIKPENLDLLKNYSIAGVAVISGILNAPNPEEAAHEYLQKLNN